MGGKGGEGREGPGKGGGRKRREYLTPQLKFDKSSPVYKVYGHSSFWRWWLSEHFSGVGGQGQVYRVVAVNDSVNCNSLMAQRTRHVPRLRKRFWCSIFALTFGCSRIMFAYHMIPD